MNPECLHAYKEHDVIWAQTEDAMKLGEAVDTYVGGPVCKYLIPTWVHPNHLSYARGPLMVPILLFHNRPWIGTEILIVAAFLDILDGMVARVRGQTSSYGEKLDAFMDKLLILPILLFGCSDLVPFKIRLTLVILEGALIGIREWKRLHQVTTRSNPAGAAKMWAEVIGLALVFTRDPFYTRYADMTLWIAVLLALGSIVGHSIDIFRPVNKP